MRVKEPMVRRFCRKDAQWYVALAMRKIKARFRGQVVYNPFARLRVSRTRLMTATGTEAQMLNLTHVVVDVPMISKEDERLPERSRQRPFYQ